MNKISNQVAVGQKVLTIRGLTIEVGTGVDTQQILTGIDLDVCRGEVLGIIGESGAGKSTLGLAALGYVRQGCRIVSGSIHFKGRDLLGLSEPDRRAIRGRRITYVAQSAAASFNPAYRLMQQTIERSGRGMAASAAARAIDLFRQMQLPNANVIGQRYPHQVSGGQLQRIMAAMAMNPQPDLIVFDEPTTALDVTTQVEVIAAIRDVVRKSGTAALYISHDLAIVAQMADRIMVLKNGALMEEAPTRQMVVEPKAAYTQSLWAVREIAKEPRLPQGVALSVKDLSVRYPRTDLQVLKDISIDLAKGCTTAVVGESGSGKTTLGRTICGLLPPEAGSISFAGQALPARLKDRNRLLLRELQLVHQSADTALNPRQSVRKILSRPIEYFTGKHGVERDRRIAELLDLVELPVSMVDRLPAQLSGGQKQRINLARALAAEPRVIVCDEVTSALDQIVQKGILQLLLKIQKHTDMTYMFITHDIATVRAIADHVVVMHRGKVVEQGRSEAVLANPAHDYTKLLMSSVPNIDPDWLDGLLALRCSADRSKKATRGDGGGG